MELSYRTAKKSDYSFVLKIIKKTLFPLISKYMIVEQRIFDEHFFKEYKNMIIVLKGNRRIGFYQIEDKPTYLYVTKIFLSPSYQGKGIGKLLMKKFEKLGYKKIKLEVWDNNPAVSFYKKLGYKIKLHLNHKFFMEKIL